MTTKYEIAFCTGCDAEVITSFKGLCSWCGELPNMASEAVIPSFVNGATSVYDCPITNYWRLLNATIETERPSIVMFRYDEHMSLVDGMASLEHESPVIMFAGMESPDTVRRALHAASSFKGYTLVDVHPIGSPVDRGRGYQLVLVPSRAARVEPIRYMDYFDRIGIRDETLLWDSGCFPLVSVADVAYALYRASESIPIHQGTLIIDPFAVDASIVIGAVRMKLRSSARAVLNAADAIVDQIKNDIGENDDQYLALG